MFHDDGPVQMLAALGGDVHAHGAEHAVQPLEDGVGDLRRGPAAHLFAHDLAGAAAHYHDLALVEMGGLRQLGRRVGRLLPHLLMQTLLLQLMHDTCHKKTPRSHVNSKAMASHFQARHTVYHTLTFSSRCVRRATCISRKPATRPTAPCTRLPGMLAAAPMPLPSSSAA